MSIDNINIKEIPIMPQVATKILNLQESNLQISFKELENIVLLDPALTTKILKVANSALYARQKEISNLQQAITLLGFKMIKSLVLLVSASMLYSQKRSALDAKSEAVLSKANEVAMWKHLLLTAFVGKNLAIKLGYEDLSEEIFIGGLLHDIGRLILVYNYSDKYRKYLDEIIKNPEKDVMAIEEAVFGFNHAEAGEVVLKNWGFPDELVDMIKHHHATYVDSPHKRAVQIVGLSNQYARMIIKEHLTPADMEIRKLYTHELGITKEIIEYITKHLIEEIKKDELYIMSTGMI